MGRLLIEALAAGHLRHLADNIELELILDILLASDGVARGIPDYYNERADDRARKRTDNGVASNADGLVRLRRELGHIAEMNASARIDLNDILICILDSLRELIGLLGRAGGDGHIDNAAVRLAGRSYHLLNLIRGLGICLALGGYGVAHGAPRHKMDEGIRHISGGGHIVIGDGIVPRGREILLGLVVDDKGHARCISRLLDELGYPGAGRTDYQPDEHQQPKPPDKKAEHIHYVYFHSVVVGILFNYPVQSLIPQFIKSHKRVSTILLPIES